MRELKFKAWDPDNSLMRTIFLLNSKGVPLEVGFTNKHSIKLNWILLQYTGLRDANDKEIYEGDILIWTNPAVSGQWVVKAVSGGWNPFIDEMLTDRPDRFQIIGNIYENPELIKKD